MVELRFMAGTLEVRGVDDSAEMLPSGCCWDERSHCHRAPASEYAAVVRALLAADMSYEDQARGYPELDGGVREQVEPRPFQGEALRAWAKGGGRGVVVLPTGAGKSQLAVMAIEEKRRAALVVAPTLDLVRQWYDLLRTRFGSAVGVIGGGDYQIEPLTVTTYDSAYLYMEHLGARFGMVVFDECHHLPGDTYRLAARFCLAPFRLGLTATPERTDGRERDLDTLVGPIVYRRDIVELSGDYLAPYETVRIDVELTPEERERYDSARAVYLAFLRDRGIRMSDPNGWSRFIIQAAQGEVGRQALDAYREQRRLAWAAQAKLDYLDELLHRHRNDRTLVFTADNAAAYTISRRLLVPCITHQTKVTERSAILSGLNGGSFRAVVTSKVLNEGVDVPRANVAIVVSGSGSVREHVQRLGRVLRKQRDKRAVLYELVTVGTAEQWTSRRRRHHVAYR